LLSLERITENPLQRKKYVESIYMNTLRLIQNIRKNYYDYYIYGHG